MAANVSIDTSEIRALAADMSKVDERLNRWVEPIVETSGRRVRDQHRREMSASRSFKGIAPGITAEVVKAGFGGAGVFEARIGPEKGRPGSLANIAYFGGSNGGGGTVPDPQVALEAEHPNFAKALAELAAEAVFGK